MGHSVKRPGDVSSRNLQLPIRFLKEYLVLYKTTWRHLTHIYATYRAIENLRDIPNHCLRDYPRLESCYLLRKNTFKFSREKCFRTAVSSVHPKPFPRDRSPSYNHEFTNCHKSCNVKVRAGKP